MLFVSDKQKKHCQYMILVNLNMLFAFFLSITLVSLASCQNTVIISLYYETLCPDSARFIDHYLYPAWSNLKPHLTIDWVPFGKATQVKKDGQFTFKCQHGRNECVGNKLHACALEKLNNTNDQAFNFIFCSSRHYSPPDSGPKCAKEVGANFTDINSCLLGNEGDELLFKYGNRTLNLDPILSTVPTYTVNGNTTSWFGGEFLQRLCAEYLPTVDFCVRLLKSMNN